MWWLLKIVFGIVVAVLWLIFGTQTLCPSCGVDLVDSPLDRLGERDRLDYCGRCGWRRRHR